MKCIKLNLLYFHLTHKNRSVILNRIERRTTVHDHQMVTKIESYRKNIDENRPKPVRKGPQFGTFVSIEFGAILFWVSDLTILQ